MCFLFEHTGWALAFTLEIRPPFSCPFSHLHSACLLPVALQKRLGRTGAKQPPIEPVFLVSPCPHSSLPLCGLTFLPCQLSLAILCPVPQLKPSMLPGLPHALESTLSFLFSCAIQLYISTSLASNYPLVDVCVQNPFRFFYFFWPFPCYFCLEFFFSYLFFKS